MLFLHNVVSWLPPAGSMGTLHAILLRGPTLFRTGTIGKCNAHDVWKPIQVVQIRNNSGIIKCSSIDVFTLYFSGGTHPSRFAEKKQEKKTLFTSISSHCVPSWLSGFAVVLSPPHPAICFTSQWCDRPAMWDSRYYPSLLPLSPTSFNSFLPVHPPPLPPDVPSPLLFFNLTLWPHTENDQPSLVWFDRGKFYLTFEGKFYMQQG